MLFLKLLLFLLAGQAAAQSLAPNTADIELQSQINMTITAGQEGGACWAGYAWHVGYGGCKRQVLEEIAEYQACPIGFTGQQSRTKTRYTYVQQGTHATDSDPWVIGAWNDSTCTAKEDSPSAPPTPPIEQRLQGSVFVASVLTSGRNHTLALSEHLQLSWDYWIEKIEIMLMYHVASKQLWCAATYKLAREGGSASLLTEYLFNGDHIATAYPGSAYAWCVPQGKDMVFGGETMHKSYIARINQQASSTCTLIVDYLETPAPFLYQYWSPEMSDGFYLSRNINLC